MWKYKIITLDQLNWAIKEKRIILFEVYPTHANPYKVLELASNSPLHKKWIKEKSEHISIYLIPEIEMKLNNGEYVCLGINEPIPNLQLPEIMPKLPEDIFPIIEDSHFHNRAVGHEIIDNIKAEDLGCVDLGDAERALFWCNVIVFVGMLIVLGGGFAFIYWIIGLV